jgi:glycosyltransferase involved in cell wall biosynthesis
MALQARQLERMLRADGIHVAWLPSNFCLPRVLRVFEAVPGVRTTLRGVLIWFRLAFEAGAADVIHVFAASWWYFFLTVYPAVLVGRLFRRRVVLNYRGGEAAEFFSKFGWVVAPAFRMSHSVTTPSEFLARVIRGRFRVPVTIVRNIVDSSKFQFHPRTAVLPRLLVTRHLEKIYDIESVLKAFRTVQRKRADASLWIAGDGSEAVRLRALVREWGLPNVTFLGAVPHDELPRIYDARDIYVNASLVDNFPGALIEASAAGLVVVTTGAGGIPFIYEHERTALMVTPGDAHALAGAIEAVLDAPVLAARLSRSGVTVARGCLWSEVREELFRAYGIAVRHAGAADARLNGAGCAAG